MSRRPNPAAEKAAANQAVIKSLLKLPGNKVCADCKRNKLPRWASWNLGVFICIRCSGIHRGMGTHISRVKSVDLDTWTDEQLQNIVKWGNTRANKYWEHKMAPGHVPSEAKIENFVRTKYESKRWVMDGGIPDPATLDDDEDAEGDDNVPLKVVKDKLTASATTATSPQRQQPKPSAQQQTLDVFADDPPASAPAPAAQLSQPKPEQKPDSNASLLGLDFFGAAPAPSPRASSVTSEPGTGKLTASSRPDLNRSILSLYASAPKPAASASAPRVQSPTSAATAFQPHHQSTGSGSFGGLSDAFSGLSFAATQPPQQHHHQQQQQQPKPSPFANLNVGQLGAKKSQAAQPQLSGPQSGGNFFSQTVKPKSSSPTSASAANTSSMNDLFDLNPPASASRPSNSLGAFSLDADAWKTPAPAASTASSSAWAQSSSSGLGGLGGLATTSSADVWGNITPTTAAATSQTKAKEEDEWGAFSSGPTTTTTATKSTTKTTTGGAGGLDDDLFGNVWK